MGLDRNSINYLLGERRRGLQPGRTLTLGHLSIYMDEKKYGEIIRKLNRLPSADGYSDEFFLGIGASSLQVMDASDYEGASVIHDLNEPIPSILSQSFDCVIDGGTLEHVFNFPIAIRNCMEMCAKDGTLILMTPWHNYAGHGFYQFSPELYYAILSEANGFEIERMLICEKDKWFSVSSPSVVQRRVEIASSDPILLFITARRKKIVPIFSEWPQQSDYMAAWSSSKNDGTSKRLAESAKDLLLQHLGILRSFQKKWRMLRRRHRLKPDQNRSLKFVEDQNGIPHC